MSKIITTAIALLVSGISFGQITITSSDMPAVDDTFRISVTQNNWSLDPTPAGANQTWDYSMMIPATQRIDTMFAVGATPTAYQLFFNNIFLYPDYISDFGIPGLDFDVFGFLTFSEVYDYYRVDTDSYKHVGFGANINGLPTPVRHDSIDDVFRFPMDYGEIDSSYMEYQITVPNLGTYRQEKTTHSEVEGWGTLITPYGTFNTLKLRREIDITDSLYLDTLGFGQTISRPTSTEYLWLANGEGVPLLKMSTGPTGAVTTIEYKDSIRSTFLSAEEHSADNRVRVYPNPSTGIIRVESEKIVTGLVIYNSIGAVIRRIKPENTLKPEINIADLPRGTYFLLIQHPDKQSIRKIIKQ